MFIYWKKLRDMYLSLNCIIFYNSFILLWRVFQVYEKGKTQTNLLLGMSYDLSITFKYSAQILFYLIPAYIYS